MDDFDQAVKVHEVLGEPADQVHVRVADQVQVKTMRRLSDRAKRVARSMIDRHTILPIAEDSLDEQLHEHVLDPNRRAILRRGVALERWLADHGFRSGAPIRFVRAHRHLHHHGNHVELPTARPVVRESFHGVDEFLTDHILDALHQRSQPATRQSGRVSVVPGFILLELSVPEFRRQFDIASDEIVHGHVAISVIDPGPVLVTTRDISGEMVAHALENELSHELAALGEYQYTTSFPTPNELLHRPERICDILPPNNQSQSIDLQARRILAERLRHLPNDCRVRWPLTLSDLGFASSDWISIGSTQQMDDAHLYIASVYLAAVLLGKVFVETLNSHSDTYPIVGYFPDQAFADITCSDSWHSHYAAANSYVNFVRAMKNGVPGAKFLDGIYQKSVQPGRDFSHGFSTHHPVRLHTYCGPLHPID